MKCSGYCTKDTLKCQLRGGKIIGLCSKNLMCCDRNNITLVLNMNLLLFKIIFIIQGSKNPNAQRILFLALVSATGSCGDKKSGQKIVFFKSPSFPDYAGGDLICDFKVRIRNDTIAVR